MVRAVRGAITVEENTPEAINEASRLILENIISQNGINHEDIISIIFSVTNDLNAAFPAVAARQLGLNDIALMCTNEIDVPGSLKKCIRVMLSFNTDKKNSDLKYIYLRGAKALRPDLLNENKIKIAIDGPAGAGKSTIAKGVAKKLDIIYLDTGAMYRTVALKAINSGVDTRDAVGLSEMVKDINIHITHNGTEQRIFLDGRDVSDEIRTPQVSVGASNVAVVPEVRLKMVELQRKIAEKSSVVMDGRDIGTYVLPDAQYKFFLTATVDERAKRRYEELVSKGIKNSTFEEVRSDMEYRDKNDSTRAFAPLTKAIDAVEIDTTSMTIKEVTDKILSCVVAK
jgi:cytidylate kinase